MVLEASFAAGDTGKAVTAALLEHKDKYKVEPADAEMTKNSLRWGHRCVCCCQV